MADSPSQPDTSAPKKKVTSPSHIAVRRGLALIAPPLLTLVVFLWVWSIIESNILVPMENVAKYVIVSATANDAYLDQIPANVQENDLLVKRAGELVPLTGQINKSVTPRNAEQLAARNEVGPVYYRYHNRTFVPLGNKQWVSKQVYDTVNLDPGEKQLRTGRNYYDRYVELKYLQRWLVIPIFLSMFICFLYFMGIFLAAGVGRFLWNAAEGFVHRFPLIRNVYGSVKQISDFILSEQEVTFMQVVAVEYPRRGIWSLGFVTGESMLDIRSAANEPIVTVLMATSPMPATGFTISVRKSETIDMNLTVDQAIQFIVSCGVVVPAHQQYKKGGGQLSVPMPVNLPATQSAAPSMHDGNDSPNDQSATDSNHGGPQTPPSN